MVKTNWLHLGIVFVVAFIALSALFTFGTHEEELWRYPVAGGIALLYGKFISKDL